MSMENIEHRSRTSSSHTRGLNALFEYNKTGQGLNVDSTVFVGSTRVRPIVRGEVKEVDSNPSKTLRSNPVYRWVRRSAIQFEATALRDEDVKRGLATIDDLVDRLSSEKITNAERRINTLAVAEKTEEVAILAAPYVPRERKKRRDEDDKEAGSNDVENKAKREKEKAPKPRNRGNKSSLNWELNLPKIPFPDMGKMRDYLVKATAKLIEKLRRDNKHESLHPLLTRFQEAGRERIWKLLPHSFEIMRTNKELMKNLTPGGFIITKIMNKYDENTGELTVDAPRRQVGPMGYRHDYEISTPLGKINAEKIGVIGIPIPTNGNYRAVGAGEAFSYSLTDVGFFGKGNNELINYGVASRYVEQDALGNVVINLKKMPEQLKDRINRSSIVLKTRYSDFYFEGLTAGANLIGALPEKDRYRLNMYPPEIAKFVTVLLEKKKNKVSGYTDNQEIFARLAQFLGDYWLTYDLLDARVNENEPVGFRQTERVLNGNLASCEGANIALGQLMRYFLEEDEGIAYVEGFVAKGSSITSKDLHLKVMYKDEFGQRQLLDATPWGEEDHEMFTVLSRRRKLAAQNWYSQSERLREGELARLRRELPQKVSDALEKIRTSWQDTSDLPKSLKKRMENKHLFLSSMHAEQPNIEQLIAETIVRHKKWFRTDYHTPRKQLGPFLKEMYNVERYGNLWSFPYGVIDGKINFDIKFLKRNLYRLSDKTSFNLFDYIDPTILHPILRDQEGQERIFGLMTNLSEQALLASNQNVEVINVVAQQVELLAEEYRERFIKIFESVRGSLNVEPNTFLESMPFLLLLGNPYNSLDGLLTRSLDPETLGFLVPVEEDDLISSMNKKLSVWKFRANWRLEQYEELIKTVKKTAGRERVVISSTYLWKSLIPEIPIVKKKDKKYLEPVETFVHLMQAN